MENPFPYSIANRRFHTYDYELKKRYGHKCFKVTLDGGFTCPNIDGTCGSGGCSYCNLAHTYPERTAPRGDNPPRRFPVPPLREQFDRVREKLHQKWPEADYIAYFQNFTNTYGDPDEIYSMLCEVLTYEHVVGVNIATRADALSDEVISCLRRIAEKTDLTVELGLQTVHDQTARRINRGHDYAAFLAGYAALEGISTCIHVINGLPGEDHAMMMETAREMARLHPESIKIHLLHILSGTCMEEEYRRGEVTPMTLPDYVKTVCDQIEILPPEMVIARVTGDGLQDDLVAPRWSLRKFVVMNEIDKELVRRGTWQGIYS